MQGLHNSRFSSVHRSLSTAKALFSTCTVLITVQVAVLHTALTTKPKGVQCVQHLAEQSDVGSLHKGVLKKLVPAGREVLRLSSYCQSTSTFRMIETKYSISAAQRITGKSRTTIAKHIKQGKLSCESDSTGKKQIDASELLRVYGDDCSFGREEGTQDSSKSQTPSSTKKTDQGGQHDLNSLRDQLDKEVAERKREREHFSQQVDHLQEALQLAQEGHNKAMLLLENGSAGVGDWEQSIAALEKRIANQEEQSREEREETKGAKRKTEQYKRALHEERNKSFFQKLFG